MTESFDGICYVCFDAKQCAELSFCH